LARFSYRAPSRGDGEHRHLGIALTIISAAQLMVVLDATIVTIALPYVQKDLDIATENLSWVVNAYTLAFGGLLLLGGRAGDLLGRRKVFIAGVLLFSLASFLGGIATSQELLLSARVLQGVGAAIASPTALALITTTFPAGPPRNRAFAVYAAMSGAGAAIGLILGGALTEIDWRWTFFINVPIGLAVAALAPAFLGESAPQPGHFDLPGAIIGTGGLVSLVYGLTHSATSGWSNTVTLLTLSIGVVALVAFLGIEARSRHALMPFRVLAERNRSTSYLAMLALGSGIFAMFYFLSLYIQNVLGYSSLRAGVAFLPFSFGIVVSAQIASALVSRIPPRFIAGPGAFLAAGGMIWLSQLTPESGYAGALLGPILVISMGMGFCFVPLTLTAVGGVAKEDSGVASAVLNTMQQVGGALGLATLSTVASRAITDKSAELGAQLQQKVASGQISQDQLAAAKQALQTQAFTSGATAAFAVGAGIVAAAGVITLALLSVRHDELATEGMGLPVA
jgi:EmrB/QacA subfamily drug resistance transporter